ncbi:hypothetical protein ZIOFF_037152 [Zingiber officinale]|uniref:Uncharacterized protein n=1 Tax=Zingiber officinale TaxID=94328 RepID=A0A8J5L371_ZINOF|nr:hypothetical protein ZIOFF_037152 [Zingiber officinale]
MPPARRFLPLSTFLVGLVTAPSPASRMAWWRRRVVAPVKRALVAVAARIKPRKHAGRDMLIKLNDEVRTCGYDDVKVMWEILQRSEAELAAGAPRSTRCSASSSCRGWWLRRASPAGVNRSRDQTGGDRSTVIVYPIPS